MIAMDRSQSQRPLSIETLSNSWLSNTKPSFEDPLVVDDETGDFIELDLDETGNLIELGLKRSSSMPVTSMAHDFSFDSNFPNSPLIIYADELFSNGILMPSFINSSEMEASDYIAEPPSPPASDANKSSTGAFSPSRRKKKKFLRKLRKIFRKHVSFS